MMDRGNCPKHVVFYSKNKFEKLVHLGGFIIRIHHDARSSECQKSVIYLLSFLCVSHIQKRLWVEII
jgi:hypothetical protein